LAHHRAGVLAPMSVTQETVEAFFHRHGRSYPRSAYGPITIHNATRKSLAQLFAVLNYTCGVEVGVETGRYAQTLCAHIPNLTLYGVDIWSSDGDYRAHVTQDQYDSLYERARARMSPYNWTPIRAYSVDAAQQFEDGSLDFVYLDANHERTHVEADLTAWLPKLRVGGIISGHDYVREPRRSRQAQNDVVDTLHAWTATHQIAPWYVLGRYRQSAPPTVRQERSRSWFWVHK
jgi:predicted O-methyltransferase YrrM